MYQQGPHGEGAHILLCILSSAVVTIGVRVRGSAIDSVTPIEPAISWNRHGSAALLFKGNAYTWCKLQVCTD